MSFFDRDRLVRDSGSDADARAGAPGKRALTDRLRPVRDTPPGGPEAGEPRRADGDELDNPFWFADGESASAADAGGGEMDPGAMRALYYGCNPRRHAEKAYQREDPAPPLHPRPTTVGKSGTIVALATTIYNRPPFGRPATFSICDEGGRALHTATVKVPGKVEVGGFKPGTEVFIRPETIGTMVKLLTPEQIAGFEEERDRD